MSTNRSKDLSCEVVEPITQHHEAGDGGTARTENAVPELKYFKLWFRKGCDTQKGAAYAYESPAASGHNLDDRFGGVLGATSPMEVADSNGEIASRNARSTPHRLRDHLCCCGVSQSLRQ
ncbi:MAG: hypothetical protein ACP5H2_00815 [Solirubrobacteraceae bacterium]